MPLGWLVSEAQRQSVWPCDLPKTQFLFLKRAVVRTEFENALKGFGRRARDIGNVQ